MLRITEELENNAAVRFRLDGTISQEASDELAELFARHQSSGTRIVIVDMAGVNFMSHEAARSIARLRGKSLRIINCSPFIAALLDSAVSLD